MLSIFEIICSKRFVLVQFVPVSCILALGHLFTVSFCECQNETNPSWHPFLREKPCVLDQTYQKIPSPLYQQAPVLVFSVIVCYQKCVQLRQQKALPKMVNSLGSLWFKGRGTESLRIYRCKRLSQSSSSSPHDVSILINNTAHLHLSAYRLVLWHVPQGVKLIWTVESLGYSGWGMGKRSQKMFYRTVREEREKHPKYNWPVKIRIEAFENWGFWNLSDEY